MSTATTVTSLLPFQQLALEDLWNRTKQATATPLPVYQGQRVAGLTPGQTAAVNTATDFATSARATEGVNKAIDANTFWLDPAKVFNLSSVPGYSAARQGIETSVGQMLRENLLKDVDRRALLSGAFGHAQQGVDAGLAYGRAADALSSNLGNLDLNVFNQLLGAHQNAIGRAPQVVAGGAVPANLALQAQGILQNQNQANIDAERQKFEEEANRPYFALDQLRASLGLMPGGTGTTTQTANADSPSWLQTGAGLAVLGKTLGIDYSKVWNGIKGIF